MPKKLNGRANCALEICCGANSPEARAALAAHLRESLEGLAATAKIAPEDLALVADAAADCIGESFDLAPKGSLVEFKREIARLAREPRGHA